MLINTNKDQRLNQEVSKEKISLRPDTHSFDTDIAKDYGIDIALMYKHVTYWVNYNKNRKSNFHEGRYWFYNTLEEITAHFPYWSADQVKRIIKKMCDLKLILKGNFNKTSFDRTVWYTINYECQMHMAESPNGKDGIATPIPNTNTNTKKTYSNEYVKKDATAPSALASNSKEKSKQREQDIYTSDEEHQKLLDEYGEEITTWSYKYFSKWKTQTPRNKWKKHDYLSIKKWVILAYHEEKERSKKLKGFSSTEDKKGLAQHIAHNFNESLAPKKGLRIDVTNQSILFVYVTAPKPPIEIPFKVNGFKDQVDGVLRKLSLL